MAGEIGESGASERRAFVVDDDSLTRHLIAAHVEQAGFRPIEVEPMQPDIESAAASAGPEDVVILDIILGPDIDGFEVIRMLGQIGFPGRLVLVSGYGADYLQTLSSLARALSLQVAGTIAKPVRPAEIRRCLDAEG
jgi:CheY-like chemotaxis protein